MTFIGNLLWFIFGGWILALCWFIVGVLWSCTIVGLPVGLQCFKFSALCAWPFGMEIIPAEKLSSLLLNILWWIFGGIELALGSLVMGVAFCITIIGIPFGIQHFKLAYLALIPFGAKISKR